MVQVEEESEELKIYGRKSIIYYIRLTVKLAFSIGMLYTMLILVTSRDFSLVSVTLFGVIVLIYCVISYRTVPKLRLKDTATYKGVADGTVNNLNIDLFLTSIFMGIALYPGQFISKTVIETFNILRYVVTKKI